MTRPDDQPKLPIAAAPSRRRRGQRVPAEPARTPVALWILRLLLHARVLHSMMDAARWPDDDVVRSIGMPRDAASNMSQVALEGLFGQWIGKLEAVDLPRDAIAWQNVAWLGDRLGFSNVERELLALAALVPAEDGLASCLKRAGASTVPRLIELFARMLATPAVDVRSALRPDGNLRALRLITIGRSRYSDSSVPLVLTESLDEILCAEQPNAEALLSRFFISAAPAALSLEDFPHAAKDATLLVSLLRGAVREKARGVNVLIYGPPGTGKTELARAATLAAGSPLYEVSVSDRDEDPASGRERLMSYAVCQRFLERGEPSVVLIDEVEDVFPRSYSSMFGLRLDSPQSKGWMNRLLERNAVPAIWVGNHVDQIDPAFVRRFDLAIELREPPPAVRARMLRQHTRELGVSDDWIARRAGDQRLRPGHIERASRVVRLVGPNGAAETERLLSRVMDGTLAAEGARPGEGRSTHDAVRYDLGLLNTSVDLESVARGLEKNRAGTLCLHGPPGTGKTAFVTHLAARLGVPLVTRRASDLLGMYLGQSEQNLARMFRDAEAQGALLFLDEADGFLQDRSRATHTWEMTQVNELLVGIERFPGIFACATNLMDTLDQAVFRRFALKIRFDPLNAEQRWKLLASVLESLGAELPAGDATRRVRTDLGRLDALTPGDFAAVVRRARILGGTPDASAVVRELREECRVKPGAGKRKMGFGY